MRKKRIASILAILLTFTLMFSGCSSKGKDQEPAAKAAAKPDTFIYGISGDPGNAVNVITTSDRYGLMEIKLLYSPLYMYNGANDVVYFLADSMTPSADFLSYTAKLKKDIKWQDGQPFTADDVVFTYEQMLKESNAGWAYGQLVFDGKPLKVEKVDDYTVKFTLPSACMSAMEGIGNIFIMPKHIYEGEASIENSTKNATPVGTGPYKLKEYKAGEYVSFEKNDTYFLGAPKIDKVVFRVIGDANSGNLALQSGEINALAIQPTDVEKMKNNPKVAAIGYSENRIGYMSFNMSSKAAQKKEVREAVSYALNRQEIINAAYVSEEYAIPAYSFLPRKATYFTENVEKHDFNLDKAKGIVAASNLSGLKLKLAYIANDVAQQKIATVMQQELKAAGMDLELVGMDSTALYEKLPKVQTEFDMYLGGYIMGIDPDTFASLFRSKDPSNYSHYSNPELDKLFKAGKVEKDPAKRQAIYEQAQMILSADAVFYPVSENKRVLGIDARVDGVKDAGLVPVYTFEDMSKLFFK